MITKHIFYKVRILRNVDGQMYVEKHEFPTRETALEYAQYERSNTSAVEITLSRITETTTTEFIRI